MTVDPHKFIVEKKCPLCGKMTRVVKAKSRQIVLKRDADGCTHYRDFNPNYYLVWVCEFCGFAATEGRFLMPLPEKQMDMLTDWLKKNPLSLPFHEERTHSDAIMSYRLGLSFAGLLNWPLYYEAALYLRLAWIFRAKGKDGWRAEQTNLTQAASLYEASLARERYPAGGLTGEQADYLLAAIYDRLGEWEKAAPFLSHIISDKEMTWKDRKTLEKARDLWQDIRMRKKEQEKKADKEKID